MASIVWGDNVRSQCQAVKYSLLNFEYCVKSLQDNALRFNPVQIAEWLADLLARGEAKSQVEVEDKLGVDRTRIELFLRLMKLPEGTRVELRGLPNLNEFCLWSWRKEIGDSGRLILGKTLWS